MLGDPKGGAKERLPKFELLGKTFERVIDNIGKRTGKPEIETGIPMLDSEMYGLTKSHLFVLAARTGQGKTSLAIQIAWNVAKQKKSVAFISLEMTKEAILERMFCNAKEVSFRKTRLGNVDKEISDKMSEFYSDLNDVKFDIIDDYCFTDRELHTLFERLKYKPDVIFLDHIQHIKYMDRRSQYETITEYLRFLKEIAMKQGIALVVLSQINREGEDKPTLANLKGAGSIEELADEVVLMHLEPQQAHLIGRDMSLRIAKNRYGLQDSGVYTFIGDFYKVSF